VASREVHQSGDSHRPSPQWITAELVDYTRRVWEPRYRRALTDGEIIEIILNISITLRSLVGRSA
jgi:hypothetical protein